MQAGEIVFPAFEIPNSALRVLIVSLIAGLPCVMITAWFLDFTPTGIRLTRRLKDSLPEPADGDIIPPSASASPTDADETSPETPAGYSLEILLLGIVVPLIAFAILLGFFALRIGEPAFDEPKLSGSLIDASIPSLAVLPFEEFSAAESDGGFFARGMHEDILTRLSRVRPLKLISRTSVMRYEGTTASLLQIGRELGVNHILEGSVRRTDTRVRVTAQLIRADTDEHIWAKNFDADLEDVFSVQTQIADAIAVALESELVPRSAQQPKIVVPAAYDAYLKARDLHRNLDADDRNALARIRHLYETALRADPGLAAAHLQLAILHAQARWFGFEPGSAPGERARAHLDAAIEGGIEADQHALAEGVLAYYLDRDFGKALLHFEEAMNRSPNDAEAIFYRAMILRRMGQLEAAIEAQHDALELDPLNLAHRDELALSLAFAGRLQEARSELTDLLLVDPSRSRARLQKWQLDLELGGNPAKVLEEMLSGVDESWQDPHFSLLETVAVLAQRPEAALAAIEIRRPVSPDSGFRDYQRAVLEGFMGNDVTSRRWLDRAQKKFGALAATELGDDQGSQQLDSVDALLSAQNGDLERALTLQQSLVDQSPIERDLVEGAPPLWQLLHYQLQAGRTREAGETLDRLDQRVSIGSILNGGYFVLSEWPEFEAARSEASWLGRIESDEPDYTREWRNRTTGP